MPLHLDHIIIAVHDLDTAISRYRAMGFTVTKGGVHANRATQNALITLADATYLELLAPTGESPIPGLIDFSVLLSVPETVVGFALRSDDLGADAAQLQTAGFAVGEIVPGERHRENGTLVQWKLVLLDGGFAPFVIQDVTPRNLRITDDPALTTHANHVVGLRRVTLAVDDLDSARARYANVAGVILHDDQPIGLLRVEVVLADGSTRDLNQLEE